MFSIPIFFQSPTGINVRPPGRPVVSVVFFELVERGGEKIAMGADEDWRHHFALIDTGADHTVIDRSLAEKLGLKPKLGIQVMSHGINSAQLSDVVVPNIYLKDCRRTLDTDAVVADLAPGQSMLIGMNVISRGCLTLDHVAHNYNLTFHT